MSEKIWALLLGNTSLLFSFPRIYEFFSDEVHLLKTISTENRICLLGISQSKMWNIMKDFFNLNLNKGYWYSSGHPYTVLLVSVRGTFWRTVPSFRSTSMSLLPTFIFRLISLIELLAESDMVWLAIAA